MKRKMKMNVPRTDLQIESRKIEEVTVTGPQLSEALEYCARHGLTVKGQDIVPSIGGRGEMEWSARVVAIRELSLVEA